MDAGRRIERAQQLLAAAAGDGDRRAGHGDRQPAARVGPDGGREHHHLPPPLPLARPARDAARPAAARRRQPPLAGLPARPADRGPRRAAGRPVGPRACARSSASLLEASTLRPPGRHGRAGRRGRRRPPAAARRVPRRAPREAPRDAPTPSTGPTSSTCCPSGRWSAPARARAAPMTRGRRSGAAGGGPTIAYEVTHRTEYHYESDVSHSYGQLHVLPRELPGQRCRSARSWSIPEPEDYRERVDFFGNRVSFLAIHEPHRKLSVTATSVVEVDAGRRRPVAGVPPAVGGGRATRCAAAAAEPDRRRASSSLDSPLVAASPALCAVCGRLVHAPAVTCSTRSPTSSHRIHTEFAYKPGATSVTTPVDEVFDQREGVCQDFAHLGDRLPAVDRAAGPLRQRLSRDRPAAGAAEAAGRRRLPRLARGPRPGVRLARRRPDQRPVRQQPVRRDRVRARLLRVPPLSGVIYTEGRTKRLRVARRRRRPGRLATAVGSRYGGQGACAPSPAATAASSCSSRTASACGARPRSASRPGCSTWSPATPTIPSGRGSRECANAGVGPLQLAARARRRRAAVPQLPADPDPAERRGRRRPRAVRGGRGGQAAAALPAARPRVCRSRRRPAVRPPDEPGRARS